VLVHERLSELSFLELIGENIESLVHVCSFSIIRLFIKKIHDRF